MLNSALHRCAPLFPPVVGYRSSHRPPLFPLQVPVALAVWERSVEEGRGWSAAQCIAAALRYSKAEVAINWLRQGGHE